MDALWQAIDIDSEAAVVVIASQLDNDEYRMGTPPEGPVSEGSFWALSHMKAVKNPPTEPYY